MSVPDRVIRYIRERETVTVEGLELGLGVSRGSARNYLSRLSGLGEVVRAGKGVYRVKESSPMEVPGNVREVREALRERFPSGKFLVWSLGMLQGYAHYGVGRDLVVVEADKALGYRVRDALVERGYNAVLSPERRAYKEFPLYNYVFVLERAERFGVAGDYPSLERLLVDVYFAMTRKGLSFSAGEYGVVLGNALREGAVDVGRALTYSSRRGIGTEFTVILYEVAKLVGRTLDGFFKKGSQKTVEEIIEGALE